MTYPELMRNLGLSAVWTLVLSLVNAALDGLVPFWVCVILGLIFGFLGTMIFVAIWRRDDSSHRGSSGSSGWDWGDW